jgi:hypothetical protein
MPTSQAPQDSHPLASPGLSSTKRFDGFPYLVTRVVPAMYHIIILPEELADADLTDVARRQARANVLETCLVLSADSALYIAPDGREHAGKAPCGGFAINYRLRLCQSFADTERLLARRSALERFIATGPPRTGYMFGDLTKGGRTATFEEAVMLAGKQPNGVPRGLVRCTDCGEWHGRCLDPSPKFATQVMRVVCRCANDNRCAACGQLLHTRKLNANEYSDRDGQIWHTPGFCGLSHVCTKAGADGARLR